MPRNTRLYYLVGPSGSGKDSLLRQLKQHEYTQDQPLVAHRYITRPAGALDENHVELSDFEFERRRKSGLFLFDWQSHGYRYALGSEILVWLKSANSVIMNGSRAYLEQARGIVPDLVVVWLRVPEDVLRERLVQRCRENSGEVEARMQRNRLLEKNRPAGCLVFDNLAPLTESLPSFLEMLNR
jgi:ribose 1,5-bisphosphokinase